MKSTWFALLLFTVSMGARAQDLSAAIQDPGGSTSDSVLSSAYSFPDTPQGGASSVVVRLTNTSVHPIQVNSIYVGSTQGSATLSQNFTVTGVTLNKTLAVGGSNFEDFTLSFTPPSILSATGYLQATYQVQENGCSFTSTDPATQCVSQSVGLSTVSGNGITPQWLLSLVNNGTSTRLQPSSPTPLSFGNVSTSGSTTYSFTIANTTPTALTTPTVSLLSQVFGSSAFSLSTSQLPASLPGYGTGSFSITFQPGQTGLTSATLNVGSLSYPIAGTGVVVASIDALQISYTDSTGVRTSPQAATPIDFGQLIPGGAGTGTLTFVVANPSTSYDPVVLPSLTVAGAGFSLSGSPTLPASIAPGTSVTFKASFAPATSGSYIGTLAIGSRSFSLKGLGITSAIPDITMQVDQSPLLSNAQVHLTIGLANPSTVEAIGTLTMTFKPTDTKITDDASVLLLGTNGRTMQVNIAKGSSNATYDGTVPITFQTGTTAGTITFTLTFADKGPTTQEFTVTPAQISITSASAVRKDPNLVITLTGFDNTYTAGPMTFTFFDKAGKALTAAPMNVNATASFHDYFFGANNATGGAFSLQATFPVTGGVADVGSVTVGLTNSSGTASTTQAFK